MDWLFLLAVQGTLKSLLQHHCSKASILRCSALFTVQLSHPYSLFIQSLSCVQLFATPRTAAPQASLSITNSWSLLKLMSFESVMPSNHLILGHSLLHLPSVLPSSRIFSTESVLHISWPKYYSFSFSTSPSSEYSGLISLGLTGLILQSKRLPRVFSNTTVQKHEFFGAQLAQSHLNVI